MSANGPWSLSKSSLDALLVSLIALDLSLAAIATFAPALWFTTMHHDVHVDALHRAFLMRSAGHWLAMAVVQVVTLVTWRRVPLWLALTAGARLSDVPTDVLYLITAPARSKAVWILLAAPAVNLALAAIFIAAYRAHRGSR
jgi:hypothetical protein